ncbi:MAG: Lipocalin-like domain-containing protein [Shouchella clausii]
MRKYTKKIVRGLTICTLILVLPGCNITKNDLIGSTWVATSGYVDGEATGEPDCGQFALGMRFVDEKTLLVGEPGEEEAFEYEIRDEIDSYGKERRFIEFFNVTRKEEALKEKSEDEVPKGMYSFGSFAIEMDGKDAFGMEVLPGKSKGSHCYLERQESD